MIGNFAHDILAPNKHVSKTYIVKIDIPLTDIMVNDFNNGVVLKDCVCKCAYLESLSEFCGKVILREGRYHQIKRMFGCYGAKVLELKRIAIGDFFLPDDLNEGDCREFTNEEILKIKND